LISSSLNLCRVDGDFGFTGMPMPSITPLSIQTPMGSGLLLMMQLLLELDLFLAMSAMAFRLVNGVKMQLLTD